MGFVHNDIKLENIVVGGNDHRDIFLIDFGLAHRFIDVPEDEEIMEA